jgi:alpha-glucosidase
MVDHGYDVSDYCDIDPTFGTLADIDDLIAEAHRLGLRVLLDWVPNHSSDQHPWFLAARSSRDDPKRHWYVWRDGTPEERPDDWKRAFPPGEPAWSWDEATEAWFLHLFTPEQPDLNWDQPELRAAMLDTLRFWLDRGVDGFRMDVVHAIGKGADLPDLTPDEQQAPVPFIDVPRTHDHLRSIRSVLDAYPDERVAVGEVYLLDPERVATYHGSGDELHLAFNFLPMFSRWRASSWRRNIETAARAFVAEGHWPTWVLSNHDNARHRTRYGGDERIARAAAVLLLTLQGTPFLYAGEELGLEDAVVPPERVADPEGGRRDGCRAPVPWTAAPGHGWNGAEPWLPFPPDATERSVEALRADERSIVHLYRRILTTRRDSPALQLGALELVDTPDGADVLAYRRWHGSDERLVVINFGDRPVPIGTVPALADRPVLVSSDPDREIDGPTAEGLRPYEAVVLA